MRFDTPIYFQTVANVYDETSGNYYESVASEEKRLASVTDTGDETLNLIFGEIRQGVKTVRLLNHYEKPFDRVRIGEKVYRVDKARNLRRMHTLIVSEVQ